MHRKRLNRSVAVALFAFAVMATVAVSARPDSGGTAPMQDLSSTEQLKGRFQQDSYKVRLIALLSPVCPACRSGFTDVQKILKEVPDNRLRAYIIWLPMFPGDSRSWAQTRSDEFQDDRLSYYWDGSKLTGEEWAKALDLHTTAWDVYFLYGSEVEWNGRAPAPSFWMHQLGGITKAPRLDKDELQRRVKELLAAVK